jgi:hypothetical protein
MAPTPIPEAIKVITIKLICDEEEAIILGIIKVTNSFSLESLKLIIGLYL